MLAILINEAIDESESGEPHVDEKKFVGRKITVADIPMLKDKVFTAFTAGMPPESDGDDPTRRASNGRAVPRCSLYLYR